MLADTVGPSWPRQRRSGVGCATPNCAPAPPDSPTSYTGATTTPCAASVFSRTVNLIRAAVLRGATSAPTPTTSIGGTLVGPSSARALDSVSPPSRSWHCCQLSFALLPSPSQETEVMGIYNWNSDIMSLVFSTVYGSVLFASLP